MPRQTTAPSNGKQSLNFAPPIAQVRNKVEGIMDKSGDLENLISYLMEYTDTGRADTGRQIIYTGLSVIGHNLGLDIVLPDGKNKFEFVPAQDDAQE